MSTEQVRVLQTIIDAGGQIQLSGRGCIGAYTKYTTGTYVEIDSTSIVDLADALLAKTDILSYSHAT
jgi:hypothetical protein